jgi:secernin
LCDTFVALGNSTKDGSVIFGKNSDRPQEEAQIIIYAPRTKYSREDHVKCTNISIPQVPETAAVLLSQPFWMWGAEMGTNDYGVVIGNEAVYTNENLRRTGLLGMDLLRLGLERGKTAKESINIITELLEKYHQGGGCAYNDPGWMYHNSFIITDPREAYVLETADDWWIVEKINDVRSISNSISIRGKGDIRRNGIIQHAIERGYCKDDENFDFAVTFSGGPISDILSPYSRGGKSALLLRNNKGKITPGLMMEFLREHDTAGICMHGDVESTGSQVSHLRKKNSKSIHWFTGSSNPCSSIYKPYIFPVKGQKVLASGPYSKINTEWFWSKHNRLLKSFNRFEGRDYIKKLRTIENSIVSNVIELISNENLISEEEMAKKLREINLRIWDNSLKIFF